MSYQEADIIDRHAYGDSLIHRLDPRAKLVATLVFIVAVVSFPKYALAPLLPFIAFPMTMAILGFLPARIFLKRIIMASPFVILVGLFNPLIDRAPALVILGVQVSGGWISFASIALRGFLCVAAAVALMGTTSFPRLIQALQSLRTPAAMTVQLMLLYRYMFVLIGEAGRMRRARSLRSPVSRIPLSIAGSMLSSLLVRTLDRADAIWLAMKARGFQDRMITIHDMKWKASDVFYLAAVIIFSVALRILPITEIIGKWGM